MNHKRNIVQGVQGDLEMSPTRFGGGPLGYEVAIAGEFRASMGTTQSNTHTPHAGEGREAEPAWSTARRTLRAVNKSHARLARSAASSSCSNFHESVYCNSMRYCHPAVQLRKRTRTPGGYERNRSASFLSNGR